MSDPITVYPIGVVSGGRSQAFEDHWAAVILRLILDPAAVDPDATLGLGQFSHIEVVFHFHKQTRLRRDAAHRACGSKGVSGLITPDPGVWRERCRDDHDTGRRDHQEAAR